MVVGCKVYCDHCNELCLPDDFTTIHIEASGTIHEFSFHNRNPTDCLAQKLTQLREQFTASPK